MESSAWGWVNLISATSRCTRWSGMSRMSTWARPSSSRARTRAGSPIRRAVSSTRERSAPDRFTSSPATMARNPWRRYSARSAARRWGSRPASLACATATRAWTGSRSARDSASWASTSMSSSTTPPAATWSSADKASRADPRPRRTAESSASSESGRPVASRTCWSRADNVSEPRRRNSKCCVRLRIVGSTFCASVVASTKTTCPGGSSRVFNNAFDAAGREHVDLVDDVDLPPARSAQGGMCHQVAHGVHAVVRGGVELVHVERRPPGDLDARVADPAGLAVLERRAVQRLGEDAGGRGLAGPPRAAEEVRVPDPAVAHGVSQSQAHVLLPEHLVEALGAETSVKRLVGSRILVAGVGHGRSLPGRPGATGRPGHGAGGLVATARYGAGDRCDGQVCYGTRPDPLRAAAFRP